MIDSAVHPQGSGRPLMDRLEMTEVKYLSDAFVFALCLTDTLPLRGNCRLACLSPTRLCGRSDNDQRQKHGIDPLLWTEAL